MEGRRRRAQRAQQAQRMEEQAQPEAIVQQEPQDSPQPQAPTQSAPPRRRRVQPPQQITQRIPKVDVPQEETTAAGSPTRREIPRMPLVEEAAEPVKRYKRAENKAGHRRTAAPKLDKQKLGSLAKTAKDSGKAVLEGLGGVLLLALMTLGTGVGKAKAALSRLRAGKDEKPQQPQAKQEYELEVIRPQDYHGRGRAHAQNAREASAPAPRRAKGGTLNASRIATVLFACIALFSLYQIGSIVLRSVRTNRLNHELAQRRAQLSETADGQQTEYGEEMVLPAEHTPTPTAELAPVLAAETTPVPQAETDDAPKQALATAVPDVVTTTKYHQVGGDALPEMAALYDENRDLVAWMEIPDVLDLPIVYRDNSYYLTRDFYKQKNASGTIFLDENHPFREKTQNLLLHGHNMKDGTMFGRLAQYLHDGSYIKNHPFIYFNTLWKKEQYVIFAILNVSLDVKNERFFNYFTHDTFYSDAEFASYIRQLQLRSEYAIPVDVQPGDALLTLSTCLDDDRLVIVARRLRSGETRSDLRPIMQTVRRQ